MQTLASALKRAKLPEDLESGLLAASRRNLRRQRNRIKKGLISKERAERGAELKAVDDLLKASRAALERLMP